MAEDSDILGLIIFAMWFRVVGLEMLFVFQSFQLMLQTLDYSGLELSWSFHGFSDINHYPFDT